MLDDRKLKETPGNRWHRKKGSVSSVWCLHCPSYSYNNISSTQKIYNYGKKYIICEDSAGGSVKGQTMQNVFKNNQQFLYEYLFQNALNFLDSFKTWYVYLMII